MWLILILLLSSWIAGGIVAWFVKRSLVALCVFSIIMSVCMVWWGFCYVVETAASATSDMVDVVAETAVVQAVDEYTEERNQRIRQEMREDPESHKVVRWVESWSTGFTTIVCCVIGTPLLALCMWMGEKYRGEA